MPPALLAGLERLAAAAAAAATMLLVAGSVAAASRLALDTALLVKDLLTSARPAGKRPESPRVMVRCAASS